MSPVLRRCFGLLALLLLCRCAAPAPFDCTLTKVTQLPLEVQGRLLIVPAGINGKWVRLVVDTGAERTVLAAATVDRLRLRADPRFTTRSIGVGGASTTHDVTVDRLVLGGVHFPVNRVAVGTFNLHNANLDADGLLGADILLAFDMDIDVPDRKLTLYKSRVCPDTGPPWKVPPLEITGVRARRDRLLLPFTLDGAAGMAFLDTGAQRNVLGTAMAARMGLTEQALEDDPRIRQHGVGPNETIAHLHHFSVLRVGPTTELDPVLPVLPTDAGFGDALLGEEFLQGRRVWISFRNRQVFVSRKVAQP